MDLWRIDAAARLESYRRRVQHAVGVVVRKVELTIFEEPMYEQRRHPRGDTRWNVQCAVVP